MSSPTSLPSLTALADLDAAIQARSACLGVVGLGTVGLPLATFAATRGFRVLGYDIDPVRANRINARDVFFEYRALLKDIPRDRLRVSTRPDPLVAADVVFVCVPTPVEDGGNIVLRFLDVTAEALGPVLKRGVLVVLESSVDIGTTRWFGRQIEAAADFVAGRDFYLAYCPERYNPGLPAEEHTRVVSKRQSVTDVRLAYDRIPRVVGGLNAKSAALARRAYESFLDAQIHVVRSLEVAEAAKLLENIFRDVNIALINEFATTLGRLGVDTYEVIRAASTKGFAFLPHYPGLVGGECIPVDTWYIIRQAERVGVDCALMRSARSANDAVVDRIAEMTCELMEAGGVPLKNAKAAILGTAYKANVFDDRVSPGRKLAAVLAKKGLMPTLCDPLVKDRNHRSRDKLADIDEALSDASVVILVTDHDIFRRLDAHTVGKLVKHRLLVDVRNALDHDSFSKAGFTVRAWGRVFHA